MSLAPTNALLQNSKKFERSGNNVRRRKTISARSKRRERALPTEAANHRPIPINLQEDRVIPLVQAVLNYLRLGTPQPVVKFQPVVIPAGSTRCTKLRGMARYILSTRTRPTAKGNKCMNPLNRLGVKMMLTWNTEINILNRYAPPRDWLAVLKLILLLDNSRTIWEASSQKAYRWDRRKGIPDKGGGCLQS